MTEPEDESDPLTNQDESQSERDVDENLPARATVRIGSGVNALGAQQRNFDAIKRVTQVGALA